MANTSSAKKATRVDRAAHRDQQVAPLAPAHHLGQGRGGDRLRRPRPRRRPRSRKPSPSSCAQRRRACMHPNAASRKVSRLDQARCQARPSEPARYAIARKPGAIAGLCCALRDVAQLDRRRRVCVVLSKLDLANMPGYADCCIICHARATLLSDSTGAHSAPGQRPAVSRSIRAGRPGYASISLRKNLRS